MSHLSTSISRAGRATPIRRPFDTVHQSGRARTPRSLVRGPRRIDLAGSRHRFSRVDARDRGCRGGDVAADHIRCAIGGRRSQCRDPDVAGIGDAISKGTRRDSRVRERDRSPRGPARYKPRSPRMPARLRSRSKGKPLLRWSSQLSPGGSVLASLRYSTRRRSERKTS